MLSLFSTAMSYWPHLAKASMFIILLICIVRKGFLPCQIFNKNLILIMFFSKETYHCKSHLKVCLISVNHISRFVLSLYITSQGLSYHCISHLKVCLIIVYHISRFDLSLYITSQGLSYHCISHLNVCLIIVYHISRCDLSLYITSQGLPLPWYCSEKSILTKQFNDSIYITFY